MEDSGFDSGDRVVNFMQNYRANNNVESADSSNENISNLIANKKPLDDNIDDLVFRNPSLGCTTQPGQDELEKFAMPVEVSRKSNRFNENNKQLSNIKGLQRKLEQKVEKAKRNFLQNECNQSENDNDFRKASDNLIPIDRLPFPRNSVKPLVEYNSDNSDDDEFATFFPPHKRKPRKKLHQKKDEASLDTFSIQDMTIIESDSNDGDKSSDDDDCDSQLNLELPKRPIGGFLSKLRSIVCCSDSAGGIF